METVSAAVQYGDFRGEAAADNHDHKTIQMLAQEHGVKGHVVGAHFYGGNGGTIQIYVYTVNKFAFNDIEAEAQANGGTLKVTQHQLEISIEDFINSFKRFSVALRYRYPSVKEMEYET